MKGLFDHAVLGELVLIEYLGVPGKVTTGRLRGQAVTIGENTFLPLELTDGHLKGSTQLCPVNDQLRATFVPAESEAGWQAVLDEAKEQASRMQQSAVMPVQFNGAIPLNREQRRGRN